MKHNPQFFNTPYGIAFMLTRLQRMVYKRVIVRESKAGVLQMDKLLSSFSFRKT